MRRKRRSRGYEAPAFRAPPRVSGRVDFFLVVARQPRSVNLTLSPFLTLPCYTTDSLVTIPGIPLTLRSSRRQPAWSVTERLHENLAALEFGSCRARAEHYQNTRSSESSHLLRFNLHSRAIARAVQVL